MNYVALNFGQRPNRLVMEKATKVKCLHHTSTKQTCMPHTHTHIHTTTHTTHTHHTHATTHTPHTHATTHTYMPPHTHTHHTHIHATTHTPHTYMPPHTHTCSQVHKSYHQREAIVFRCSVELLVLVASETLNILPFNKSSEIFARLKMRMTFDPHLIFHHDHTQLTAAFPDLE